MRDERTVRPLLSANAHVGSRQLHALGGGEQDKSSKEGADRDGMRMAAGSADDREAREAREARETAAKLQPAHYRTRNDFATQPRSRRQLAEEAAAAAAAAPVAGAGCERVREVAADAEMVATAQVAALQAFGASCGVDLVVEGLLRCDGMMGMRRLQLEGCSSLAACALRRACDRFCMLTHLDVKGAVQVDDTALKHIASVCQRLELLQVTRILFVSVCLCGKHAFVSVCLCGKHAVSVYLSACLCLPLPVSLSLGNPSSCWLRQVGGCTSITDEGVVAFCEEVKRLVPGTDEPLRPPARGMREAADADETCSWDQTLMRPSGPMSTSRRS